MKNNSTKITRTFGEFVTCVYDVCGKRKAGRIVQVAIKSHLILIIGLLFAIGAVVFFCSPIPNPLSLLPPAQGRFVCDLLTVGCAHGGSTSLSAFASSKPSQCHGSRVFWPFLALAGG
jgi:hypothetical protein